jgi:hypothetical protein
MNIHPNFMTTCDTDAHNKIYIPFNSTAKDFDDPYMAMTDNFLGTANFKDLLNNQHVVRLTTGPFSNKHGRNGSSNSKSSKRYEHVVISNTMTSEDNSQVMQH